MRKLRNYLTINVSAFLRDADKFAYLQENVLSELLHHRPRVRVWSAGCSYGHEPYSLAMILAEMTGSYARHTILATDIDHDALDHAQAGGPYKPQAIANVPENWRERYFKQVGADYFVSVTLRQRVTFTEHNLLVDPFENNFDLIVCRNVVIYFTQEIKRTLYHRLYDALRPGGILFVGGTEVITRFYEVDFRSIGMSFYQK